MCAYYAYVTIRRALGVACFGTRHFVNTVSGQHFSAENKQEAAEFDSQYLPMHFRGVIWKIKSKSNFPVSFSLINAEMNLVGNYRTLRGLRTVNPEGLPSTTCVHAFHPRKPTDTRRPKLASGNKHVERRTVANVVCIVNVTQTKGISFSCCIEGILKKQGTAGPFQSQRAVLCSPTWDVKQSNKVKRNRIIHYSGKWKPSICMSLPPQSTQTCPVCVTTSELSVWLDRWRFPAKATRLTWKDLAPSDKLLISAAILTLTLLLTKESFLQFTGSSVFFPKSVLPLLATRFAASARGRFSYRLPSTPTLVPDTAVRWLGWGWHIL